MRLEAEASWEAPQDAAPTQRFPRASNEVPLENMTSVDGSIINFAPGEMIMSPLTVCDPDHVSIELM